MVAFKTRSSATWRRNSSSKISRQTLDALSIFVVVLACILILGMSYSCRIKSELILLSINTTANTASSGIVQSQLLWFKTKGLKNSNDTRPSLILPLNYSEIHKEFQSMLSKTTTTRTTRDVPKWMKDYMVWHGQQIKNITLDNWKQYKYLLLRCFKEDQVCGGASDRLKPIPLLLLAAAKSKRVFFISWTKPCALEEFMVPTVLEGGLNWTLPSWLGDNFRLPDTDRFMITRANMILPAANRSRMVMQTHLHDYYGGSKQYNEVEGKLEFERVFHSTFRLLFQPSSAISNEILKSVTINNKSNKSKDTPLLLLVPGSYSVAHFRADYGKEVQKRPILKSKTYIEDVTRNAIDCAQKSMPGYPTYFASDSSYAIAVAHNVSKEFKRKNNSIITLHQEEQTWDDKNVGSTMHLDYNQTSDVSDFYSTFIDLFIMGNGRCVMYGRGGFGSLAALMSYNQSCSLKHVVQFKTVDCTKNNGL